MEMKSDGMLSSCTKNEGIPAPVHTFSFSLLLSSVSMGGLWLRKVETGIVGILLVSGMGNLAEERERERVRIT